MTLFRERWMQPLGWSLAFFILAAGWLVNPFRSAEGPFGSAWRLNVDALPDLSENQQIVVTQWAGQSPEDVEDRITYPLSSHLTGVSGVSGIRSLSMTGRSTVYLLFDESVDAEQARTRVLERLSALPQGWLPEGVQPALGPNATGLGQVFWYVLQPAAQGDAGSPEHALWDLHELRDLHDDVVMPSLASVPGVAEVAPIGGTPSEIWVEVDPGRLRLADVPVDRVAAAVAASHETTGLRTLEHNGAEYAVRLEASAVDLESIRKAVVQDGPGAPVRVEDLAWVTKGPAPVRGALDVNGKAAVGGIVTLETGQNPERVIRALNERIGSVERLLPSRTGPGGETQRLRIEPVYDRSLLIRETLETLRITLQQQALVTLAVVGFLAWRIKTAAVISAMLPLAVLGAFILMRLFGVDANIVSLAGISIAIGSIVDMGIIFTDALHRSGQEAGGVAHDAGQDGSGMSESGTNGARASWEVVRNALREAGPAILTAGLTTVISFLPVLLLSDAEGRLFRPLALTKTFVLMVSLLLVFALLPLLGRWAVKTRLPWENRLTWPVLIGVLLLLASIWQPSDAGYLANLLLVGSLSVIVLGAFKLFEKAYVPCLKWMLRHRAAVCLAALVLPAAGFASMKSLGREFMPSLDEGQFMLMPSTMPQAGFTFTKDVMQTVGRRLSELPEVETATGKLGRAETALDPAPISMLEILVTTRPEFGVDSAGNRVRNWRDEIRDRDELWNVVAEAAAHPALSGSPRLQPIETRWVMLQTGMRSAFGIRLQGSDLDSLTRAALGVERVLREVPQIRPQSVFAEQLDAKPTLEILPDRDRMLYAGLTVAALSKQVSLYQGQRTSVTVLDGRESIPVRIRAIRSSIDDPYAVGELPIFLPTGEQVRLSDLAEVRYRPGAAMIRSEDTFRTLYVFFDKEAGWSDVEVAEAVDGALKRAIESGDLALPAAVGWEIAGTYENQVRASQRLSLIVPVTLLVILLLLWMQFRSLRLTGMVFIGVAMAWSGAFVMLWFYSLGGGWVDGGGIGGWVAALFRMQEMNVSVAVWVGLLALFGISVDDGVVMLTLLRSRISSDDGSIRSSDDAWIRRLCETANLRVSACLMTTATTLLALLPVLTSTGRGSDLMLPMAVPIVGGVVMQLTTLFLTPLLYSFILKPGRISLSGKMGKGGGRALAGMLLAGLTFMGAEAQAVPAGPVSAEAVIQSVSRTELEVAIGGDSTGTRGATSPWEIRDSTRYALIEAVGNLDPHTRSVLAQRDAQAAKTLGAGGLPYPMLTFTPSFSTDLSEPDPAIGSISVMQAIPNRAKRDAAAVLAEAQQSALDADHVWTLNTRRSVADSLYVEWNAAGMELSILAELTGLHQQVIRLLVENAQERSTQALVAFHEREVLIHELRLDSLRQEQRRTQSEAQFHALAGADLSAQWPDESVGGSTFLSVEWVRQEDSLRDALEMEAVLDPLHDPWIRKAARRLQVAESFAGMAEAGARPDLQAGLGWGTSMMGMAGAGTDYRWMPMASVQIPVGKKDVRAEQKGAELDVESARLALEAVQAAQQGRRQSRSALLLRQVQELKTVEEDLLPTLDRMIAVLELRGQGGSDPLIALLDLRIRKSAYQLRSLRLQRNIELDLIWFRARSGWYAAMDAHNPQQKLAGKSGSIADNKEDQSVANTIHYITDKP